MRRQKDLAAEAGTGSRRPRSAGGKRASGTGQRATGRRPIASPEPGSETSLGRPLPGHRMGETSFAGLAPTRRCPGKSAGVSGQRSADPGNRPVSRDSAPLTREIGRGSRDSAPLTREIGRRPRDSAPMTREIGRRPRDSAPLSREIGRGSHDSAPLTREIGRRSRDRGRCPGKSVECPATVLRCPGKSADVSRRCSDVPGNRRISCDSAPMSRVSELRGRARILAERGDPAGSALNGDGLADVETRRCPRGGRVAARPRRTGSSLRQARKIRRFACSWVRVSRRVRSMAVPAPSRDRSGAVRSAPPPRGPRAGSPPCDPDRLKRQSCLRWAGWCRLRA